MDVTPKTNDVLILKPDQTPEFPLCSNYEKPTIIPEFFKQYLFASLASLAPKTVLAPIDRMKLLAQSQNELIRTGKLNKEWNGYMDLIKRTNKHEGVFSFWKGNGAYLFRYSVSSGLGLTVKDQLHRLDKQTRRNNRSSFTDSTKTDKNSTENNKSSNSKAFKNFFYGGVGGLTGMAVAYPLEYARTRLGSDLGSKRKNNREFSGILDTLKKAHKAEGIKGMYKGFSMTVPTIFLYRGIQYGGYDTLTKKMDMSDNKLTGYFYKFLIGWGIGIGANVLVHPLNTLRVRRVLTTGENKKYEGWIQQFRKIGKTEGYRVLYKGFMMQPVKNLGTALVLVVYDYLKQI